jgi:DNA-binding beta-propeller fold protein YncE
MSRQSKAALAAVLGLLIGVGALVGVVLALRDSDGTVADDTLPLTTDLVETTESVETTTVEEPPVQQTRTIEVGGFPNTVAVGEGGVWVVRDGRRVIKIDPATGAVVARIGAGDELGSERPCGIAVGQGAVWVTTVSGGLARINPRTNRLSRLIEIEDAACVVAARSGIWVTSPNLGLVTRIDPDTGDVVAEIEVDGFPQGIDVGFGSVWVASADPPEGINGAVSRINPRSNGLAISIPVGELPEYVDIGEGGVWVTADDGSVKLIEPSTNQVIDPPAQISEGGRTSVTVGGGFVWATTILGPDVLGAVTQIDPNTSEPVADPIPVGENPLGLAFGEDALWVANYSDGTVTAYTP